MSLLTPPSTAHRRAKDKENAREADPICRVAWAENDKVHILHLAGPAASSFKVSTAASASKRLPSKSILKKCTELAPWPGEKQREVTPEPSDPLADLEYLKYPVKTILEATEETELRVMIEAYSILTARLRTAVTSELDDASWPLFQPLRKHKEAFVEAVVRDLGKAFVDPAAGKEPLRVLLPSPSNTPVKKKKRDGLSAEQVKYARDLCTTSHAVIRLLSLVFTLPAMMDLFTTVQLRSMFAAVLAIPLADDLPTPNARKTWALAIWLIQTQRLSAAVLAPAADRIAFALCRGIDGELGKEGKKGSASDGLKAIHDLSVHLPAVFIPAFTNLLLPSVLSSLLAPTLALRTHAAHALGGFVIGATSIPNSLIHAQISNHVLKYITTLPPSRATPSPTKRASPTKPMMLQSPTKPQEPSIIKTLRMTLQATEPAHVAHGPVWGTCVLSALIVLLGPAAMRVPHLRVLVHLGMRHKNRNVRALTTVMWRCIVWVYVHPRLITTDEDGEDEVDEREMEREVRLRDEWWKVVASVVEMETGVCAIAATIGSGNVGVPVYDCAQWVDVRLRVEEREEQPLRRALEVLCAMARRDAPTRESAIDTIRAMVGMPPSMRREHVRAREYEKEERTLVPKGLFSAMPGLLTTEYTAMKEAVKALFDETPKAEDVRVLSKAEMRKVWVWEGVVRAWRAAVGAGKGEDWKRLLQVWEGMVSMGLGASLDPEDNDPDRDIDATPPPHDEKLVTEFIEQATVVIIVHVLEDADLDLQPSLPSNGGLTPTESTKGLEIPGFSPSLKSSVAKLGLARDMWSVVCRLAPHTCIGRGAERLVQCLMKNAEEFTTFGTTVAAGALRGAAEETEDEKGMNEAWAELCLEGLAACGYEAVRAFWRGEDGKGAAGWRASERALVWRVFARGWVLQNSDAGWEGAVCTLVVPFCGGESWILTSEDAEAWQKLLDFAIAASLDHGHDSNTVLGVVARLIEDDCAAGYRYMPVHIRLVEFVLNHLAGVAASGDLRELPEAVLDFVATTMGAAYPPSLDQTTYTWTVRAVTSLVDRCPRELLEMLGESMSGALAAWLADAEDKWEKGVIEYDIVPLYETLLVTIQGCASVPLLSCFGPALCAPLVRETRAEIHGPAVDAFKEFWDTTYADIRVPEEGWSADIAACLKSVYGAPEEEREAVIAELEAAFVLRPSTPTPSTPSRVLNTPSTPCSSFSASFYDDITPKTLSTPRCLSRSARPFVQLIESPESPMPTSRLSALSRPPTPRTFRSSPAKRRKLVSGNKENFSPIAEVAITPVIDRILASSPLASRVKLGKRRFEEDSSEDERGAVESLVIPPEGDVFFVTQTPKPTQNTENRTSAKKSIPSTKKRKRVVMDAVEMPPLSRAYTRTLRPSASFELVRTPTILRRSVRRTRSESKISAVRSDGTRSSKRRKGVETRRCSLNEDTAREEILDIGGMPLRALAPSENRASFYSYSLVRRHSKRAMLSSELSSDDDPHFGQVTPHHLISPDLKRGKVTDPPSDDSVVVSSPSRDIVERKLQRTRSGSSTKITPFVV